MYNSLNDYLDFLESKGELIRIKEFTDPIYDITKITDIESKKDGGGKALLFENTGTEYCVATNIMGSNSRILYGLGLNYQKGESWECIHNRIDDLFSEITKARMSFGDKIKILPTISKASKWFPKRFKGAAPSQEIVVDGVDCLPILKCWPQDGGRFITLPMVHTQDPKTGLRNLGMYRMQVFDNKTTGMHWHMHKTGAKHYREWQKYKGDNIMPVAVTLGGDPVYSYCATAPLPDGVDEYILAGFLRNKPVELVKCKTQPLEVPADCDFVIEGYVDVSEEKVMEGPFGDHTGFYSLPDIYPLFHITCITRRRDAIYPATIVGIPPMEDKYLAIATEKIFLSPIKIAIAPEIIDLHLPEEGVGHNFAIVKINKTYPGQGLKIASALWGAGQMMFNKFMVIVSDSVDGGSDEIDIRNKSDVAKAINNNYSPHNDTYTTNGPLDILDHTAPICGFGGKMCIDATIKFKGEGTLYKSLSDRVDNGNNIRVSLTNDIVILLDSQESPDSKYRNLWLLGSNCDPVRDSWIENGKLVLDATTKKAIQGFNREWPDEVKF